MRFNKTKAAALLLAPPVPLTWLILPGLAGILWLTTQLSAEPLLQTPVLGLPAILLSIRSRALWRVESVRLVPELPLSLFQLVVGAIALFFAAVSLVMLASHQPLDTLLIHSAISLVLVITARVATNAFWLACTYLTAYIWPQLLGDWTHLYWMQLLFLIGNFGLVVLYYACCTSSSSETDWFEADTLAGVGEWATRDERKARFVRFGIGYAVLFLVGFAWAYQVGDSDLFFYYTGPLVVLGVPLILLESIKPKMISWWVTARDNTRSAMGLRAMLSIYASTLLVAGFFFIIALIGLIAVGRINWLILSNLLLAVTLASLLLCVTVHAMDRLKTSGTYLLYIVSSLALVSLVMFWLGSFVPAGPVATLLMATLAVLVGALCARVGSVALAQADLF